MKVVTRQSGWRIVVGLAVLAGAFAFAGRWACRCGGVTTMERKPVGISADNLRRHVTMLAGTIGPRSVFRPAALRAAADYIEGEWRAQGWAVNRQVYEVNGMACANLEVVIPGRERALEIVVVGAHYDTVDESPGANDNGSGVAALLELSREFTPQARTVRFVAFVNEEPPWFHTERMGSRVYAQACRQRGDDVRAMIALETMGYYRDEPGSQRFPSRLFHLVFPDRGNFIGFVSDLQSRWLLQRAAAAFRARTDFPLECAALPRAVTGVDWSDHASFWQEGYRALMVTDTAPFRYPHDHEPTDTPDKIDYHRLAAVTDGVGVVVAALARD